MVVGLFCRETVACFARCVCGSLDSCRMPEEPPNCKSVTSEEAVVSIWMRRWRVCDNDRGRWLPCSHVILCVVVCVCCGRWRECCGVNHALFFNQMKTRGGGDARQTYQLERLGACCGALYRKGHSLRNSSGLRRLTGRARGERTGRRRQHGDQLAGRR